MGWSDFLFLIIGLGLGLVGGRLWPEKKDESRSQPSSISPTQESTSDGIQDVSEQLRQTRLAYQMASEMSKFKAGFLARTSHELRSPINSTIGTLQLIISDLADDPEEEREFANQAYNATLKTLGLLDEIVAVAKAEHGTETMKLQAINLARVFEEVEDLTYLQAANRSIRLKISPPDPDVYVLADELRLKQVLVSLVDTAIAEMDEGYVNVSVHPSLESGYVHIWIEDQRPRSAWSESWDLLKHNLEGGQETKENITYDFQLSPGMRLLMNQTLLSLMNGRLEVLAVPSDGEDSNFNRTQCSLPLAIPDPDDF